MKPMKPIWNPYETHMKPTWNLKPTWNPHATYMKQPTWPWNPHPHETHMKPTWNPHETYMKPTWNPHETHMKPTWNPQETHMKPVLYTKPQVRQSPSKTQRSDFSPIGVRVVWPQSDRSLSSLSRVKTRPRPGWARPHAIGTAS